MLLREGGTAKYYYEESGGNNRPTTIMKAFLKKRGILKLERKDRRWEQAGSIPGSGETS